MALVPYSDSEGEGEEKTPVKKPTAMQEDVPKPEMGKRGAAGALPHTELKHPRLPPPSFTGDITAPTFVNQVEHHHEDAEEEEPESLPPSVALVPPQVRFRKPNRVTEDREAIGLRPEKSKPQAQTGRTKMDER